MNYAERELLPFTLLSPISSSFFPIFIRVVTYTVVQGLKGISTADEEK
jgi:hypothetical protein